MPSGVTRKLPATVSSLCMSDRAFSFSWLELLSASLCCYDIAAIESIKTHGRRAMVKFLTSAALPMLASICQGLIVPRHGRSRGLVNADGLVHLLDDTIVDPLILGRDGNIRPTASRPVLARARL